MKKILLLAVMLFSAIAIYAGGDVTLKEGSLLPLKDATKTICVEIDHSNTVVEGSPIQDYLKARGEKNVQDWPTETNMVKTEFMEKYNDETKFAKVVVGMEADFKFVIVPETMDLGSTGVSAAVGLGGGCKVNGYVNVIDQKTQKIIAKISLEKANGGLKMFSGIKKTITAFSETGRRKNTAKFIAEEIAKLVKKAK